MKIKISEYDYLEFNCQKSKKNTPVLSFNFLEKNEGSIIIGKIYYKGIVAISSGDSEIFQLKDFHVVRDNREYIKYTNTEEDQIQKILLLLRSGVDLLHVSFKREAGYVDNYQVVKNHDRGDGPNKFWTECMM